MNSYVTGSVIRSLREGKGLTQEKLAELLHVSAKAVSKWETGRGFPDISLLEPLAQTLGISVLELLSGGATENRNKAFNMQRIRIYVCPVCGNVILAAGEAVISCCGVTLLPQEAEDTDEEHCIGTETVEDEVFVSMDHPMTKTHYISFFLAVSDQGNQFVKLYPEGNAEARFKISRVRKLYAYCNRHGLFEMKYRTVRARPAE